MAGSKQSSSLSAYKRFIWPAVAIAAVGVGLLVFRGSGDRGVSTQPSAEPRGAQPSATAGPKLEPADRDIGAPSTSTKRDGKAAEPSSRALSTAPPNDLKDDPLKVLHAAKADPSEAGTDKLIGELTSRDDVAVAEAANELIRRGATRAIRPLAAIRLKDAAGSGLSIIDALGRLGAVAKDQERTTAVERLLAMLEEEKRRDAPESAANLLQIYEALGRTQDTRAARALEAELLDAGVGRAPKVVIVQSLVWIGADSSKAALIEARRQQTELAPTDDFDAELRTELIGVIDEAIELL